MNPEPGLEGGPVSSTAFRASVLDASTDAYLVVDTGGRIVWASAQVEDLLGYSPSGLVGQPVELLVPESVRSAHVGHRSHVDLDEGPREMRASRVLRARCEDGHERAVDIRLNRFGDDQVLAVVRDASRWASEERKLQALAGTDPLTGIANRRMVLEHVESALARCRRHGGRVGVAFLDLDGFKAVNDDNGHEAGDQVLKAVANRLRDAARQGDLVGRVGGDEFIVTLEELEGSRQQGLDQAVLVAERMMRDLTRPVHYAGVELPVRASAGVAISDGEEMDGDDLIRAADRALYVAKGEADLRVVPMRL